MAYAPLVLAGALRVNDADVSAQVKEFAFGGDRVEVNIPAVLGGDMSFAAGPAQWFVTIRYMPDTDAAALTQVLWTAMTTSPHTITVSGTMRDGAVSASNPRWHGTAVVTQWGLGGRHYDLAEESHTFKMTAAPTRATT